MAKAIDKGKVEELLKTFHTALCDWGCRGRDRE
jgi:hypothetical protein